MIQESETAKLERLPTGIPGLKHITMGGIVKGRTTLVVGTSGAGKTLLSIQTLYEHISQFGGRAILVTFEEQAEDIVRNVQTLGWDLEGLINDGRLTVVDASPQLRISEQAGNFDLSGFEVQLRHAIEQSGADLVVLDSMGGLFAQFNDDSTIRREVFRISRMIRDLGLTGLMTAERVEERGPISRHNIEEFVADCVIVLRHDLNEEKVRRTIQVYKLRGDRHRAGEFPFTISDDGIVILPLSAAKLDRKSDLERVGFGNDDFNQMAGGGLFRDSIILVSGPTGCGKTLLSTTFASEACKNGERVLYVGYEESEQQLTRNAQAWGYDFEHWQQQGLLRIISQYPESTTLEAHLLQIRKEIETFKPSRLVVDSLSALEKISLLRNFREFVIGLTSFLKEKQICALATSTSRELSGGDSVTDAHISTITDSIILLRYVESNGELRRGIVVIKMRGSQHEKSIREFKIDDQGLHILAPFSESATANVPSFIQRSDSPGSIGGEV